MTEGEQTNNINTGNDWNRYYLEPTVSFRDGLENYGAALSSLRRINPDILDPDTPKTFLLGGFHPYNGTPMEFLYFCEKIHPNNSDQIIFLDMNPQAVESAPKRNTTKAVLGKLEELPFDKSTIDFMFLDFTPYFMSNEQINAFATKANDVLTKNGLVLIAKRYLLLEKIDVEDKPFVPRNPRSIENLLNLLSPLKPVNFTQSINFTNKANYITLAKQESDYPEELPSLSVLREGTFDL